MTNDIRDKLREELSKKIVEESQVVYILSRIRKILEKDKDKNQGKYQKLKFYCDWALHVEIGKGTKAFQKELEKFIQGDREEGVKIFMYRYFELEFLDFLEEYDVSDENYLSNQFDFKRLMAKIYSDTPLMVTFTQKFKITCNEGIFTRTDAEARAEIGYNITLLD